MSTKDFYDQQREQSKVKARIVAKYFKVWAKIIAKAARTHDKKMAYIDLYAGPGRYDDGSKSTPLKILETAIGDEDIRNMLVTYFNDKDKKHLKSLETAIKSLPGIKTLKYEPSFYNEEVGEEIASLFEGANLVPSFFFIDPWGYKGLSLKLVGSVLKDWGCDCVFFFNYNRIKPALVNKKVEKLMWGLFGESRVKYIQSEIKKFKKRECEKFIMGQLTSAVKEKGYEFVHHFRFICPKGQTYYLVFVTKHFRGYEKMKEIMAPESTFSPQGVPTYEFYATGTRKPTLSLFDRLLDDLCEILLDEYAGQELTVQEIYEKHSVDRPYILKNYKRVLQKMLKEGKIEARHPSGKLRNGTMPDKVIIAFPKR